MLEVQLKLDGKRVRCPSEVEHVREEEALHERQAGLGMAPKRTSGAEVREVACTAAVEGQAET